MAVHDDRMRRLLVSAAEAADGASTLGDIVWPDLQSRNRLQEILAYAQIVIQGTDGALVPDGAVAALEATLEEFRNSPGQVAAGAEGWMERFLDQLKRLPPAHGRDFEQRAKEAAITFQRSAQNRLSAVKRQARETSEDLEQTKTRLESLNRETQEATDVRLRELKQSVTELQTAFESRLQGYESNLETEREEGLRLRGEQAQAFQAAQADQASQARENIEALEAELKQRATDAVAGLETSREEVAELVDLVTTSTTSGGFAAEANEQKTEADKWRNRAILVGLVAALVAAFAVGYAIGVEVKTSLIVAKAGLVIAFGGLAGYAAKQSAEHRHREVRARRLALELTAFGPFSHALDDPEKERKVREDFIERIFVGEDGLPDKPDTGAAALTSGDVTVVGQLFDLFRKAAK